MKSNSKQNNSYAFRRQVKEIFASASGSYGDLYSGKDPLAHLFLERLEIIHYLIEDIRGDNVLDVGCGPGMIAPYLIERNCDYFGLDLSMGMLVDHQHRTGHGKRDHLVLSDMELIPFQDSSFDTVLCLGVLEYLRDPSRAIKEQSRVMRLNGNLIIAIQNRWSPYRFWERHIYHCKGANLLRRIAGREKSKKIIEVIHPKRSLLGLLAESHLKVTDVVYYDFNIFPAPLDRYFPKLTQFFAERLVRLNKTPMRVLGSGFIVKAVKSGMSRSSSQVAF